MRDLLPPFFFFFFNDTATTEIYTLSLHDALPISAAAQSIWRESLLPVLWSGASPVSSAKRCSTSFRTRLRDRKSTRLNSSHSQISYAVFCLKKKTNVTVAIAISTLVVFTDVERAA